MTQPGVDLRRIWRRTLGWDKSRAEAPFALEVQVLAPDVRREALQVLQQLLVGPHRPAGARQAPLRELRGVDAAGHHGEGAPEGERQAHGVLGGLVRVQGHHGAAVSDGLAMSVLLPTLTLELRPVLMT